MVLLACVVLAAVGLVYMAGRALSAPVDPGVVTLGAERATAEMPVRESTPYVLAGAPAPAPTHTALPAPVAMAAVEPLAPATLIASATTTHVATATETGVPTATATPSPSATATPLPSPTVTPRSLMASGSQSPSATASRTYTPSPTRTATRRPATPTAPPPTVAPPDAVLAEIAGRINSARAAAGLPALAWSAQLGQAAGAHAADLLVRGAISHEGTDGSDVTARMRRAGYVPLYWGEVITWAPTGAASAFDQWWNSQHHHDILLGGNFSEMGGAWAPDPRADPGGFSYYVFVFGRRSR